MLRVLAGRYGVQATQAQFGAFFSALGGGALLGIGARYGVRELVKLIPGVGILVGVPLNAASAFALTLGSARPLASISGWSRPGESSTRRRSGGPSRKAWPRPSGADPPTGVS